MPRALLSVSDKEGILHLARGLVAHGFELVFELVSPSSTAHTIEVGD